MPSAKNTTSGWLAQVLATAAELGSTAALTSSRPGSWKRISSSNSCAALSARTTTTSTSTSRSLAVLMIGAPRRTAAGPRRRDLHLRPTRRGRARQPLGRTGWCGTNDLGPLDSHAAQQQRTELQTALGRPLRRSDLATPTRPPPRNDHDLTNLLPTPRPRQRTTHRTPRSSVADDTEQRVDAMRRGDLTLEQCCAWAARHPDQVPLLHGEFEFIAAFTPEARE